MFGNNGPKSSGKSAERDSLPGGDISHKQTFSIRDLRADNVTIYPTQAAIVREIEGIQIKPGRNEITINDLTELADEHSIKVEGRGDAIITDTTIISVFNKFLPGDDEEEEEEEEESEEEEAEDEDEVVTEEEEKDATIEKLEEEIQVWKYELASKWEVKKFAQSQLEYLEAYGKSMTAENAEPSRVQEFLEMYGDQRSKLYNSHSTSSAEIEVLNKQTEKAKKAIAKREKEIVKESKEKTKAAAKAKAEKAKIAAKKAQAKEHKLQEKLAKQNEQRAVKYNWPKTCKQIKIMLEGTVEEEASLKISYIVLSASWTPRYDLRLDTISKTGQIIYKAEVVNKTFETWRDAQVKLSTSVTTFAGLSDKVPYLNAWHVGSGKRTASNQDASNGLYSLAEQQANNIVIGRKKEGINEKRGGFMVPPQLQQQQQAQMQMQMMQQATTWQSIATQPAPLTRSLFGSSSNSNAPPASSAFGAPAASSGGLFGAPAASSGGLFGDIGGGGFGFGSTSRQRERDTSSAPGAPANADDGKGDDSDDEEEEDAKTETSTLTPSLPSAMAVSQTRRDTHGLTTTYALPSLLTISHSNTSRRYVISNLDLPVVAFSSIVVPKLRPAAFLKARITNNSGTTLLRGNAGLTLDGSYLGNTIIPNCAEAEAFSLSLGIDSGVTVGYGKPTRKTSSKGYINKEEMTLYSRVINLANNKSTPITIQVLDQVPVSEDEKVRISIITPKNLKADGDSSKTGVAGTTVNPVVAKTNTGLNSAAAARLSVVGEKKEDWGTATATLKKDGTIIWIVKLEKGRNCKLGLEYEVKSAPGEGIYGIN